MSAAVSIRPATEADGEALAALDRATWSAAVTPAPAPDLAAHFFSEKRSPEDVLVGVIDGEVVGYVHLARPTPLESNRHVVEGRGLAVAPGMQGRGIGRALVDAAIAEARGRSATRFTLRVLSTNSPARAIYEAAGFEVEGVLRGEFLLDGREVDDVLMASRLD